MKLSNITIVFFALIGKMCSAEIVVRTSKPADPSEDIIDAAANILASCYGNKEFAIGLYGNVQETFIEKLWSRTLVPIVLINDTDYEDPRSRYQRYRIKLNVFVIIANDYLQVLRGFIQTQSSRWANRKASFLIVDWAPTVKYGCSQISKMFYLGYLTNITNINLLCLNPRKARIILGYNPHTRQAPAPWRLIAYADWDNSRRVAIFLRHYKQGVCENLDFDKLNDLGGHLFDVSEYIRLNVTAVFLRGFKNKTLLFTSEEVNIIETFGRQLNGTIAMQFIKPSGPLMGIVGGCANLGTTTDIEITYPCMQMDLKIITHFKGYKSQLRKILTVVDVYSRFGTCLVLLVTLIFFKFYVRQALIPATLNIVRIICNTGFENLPENRPSRIYITVVLLFVVTMQGIFTGNLASLLTTEVPFKNVETLEDLLNSNYTIYVRGTFSNLFKDLTCAERVISWGNADLYCIDVLLRDPNGACVDLEHLVTDPSAGYNVHISSNPIFNVYWVMRTEFDWYLLEKFNKVLITMVEAEIVDAFDMRLLRNRLSYVEPVDEDPKVMTLKDLLFAFVILGIGLVCATVTFIVEISIKPIRSAIAKVRRRLSNRFREIKIRKLT